MAGGGSGHNLPQCIKVGGNRQNVGVGMNGPPQGALGYHREGKTCHIDPSGVNPGGTPFCLFFITDNPWSALRGESRGDRCPGSSDATTTAGSPSTRWSAAFERRSPRFWAAASSAVRRGIRRSSCAALARTAGRPRGQEEPSANEPGKCPDHPTGLTPARAGTIRCGYAALVARGLETHS